MLFVASLTSKSCGIVMLHCCQVQHFVLKKSAKEEKRQTVLCIHGPSATRASAICPGCGVSYQCPVSDRLPLVCVLSQLFIVFRLCSSDCRI